MKEIYLSRSNQVHKKPVYLDAVVGQHAVDGEVRAVVTKERQVIYGG